MKPRRALKNGLQESVFRRRTSRTLTLTLAAAALLAGVLIPQDRGVKMTDLGRYNIDTVPAAINDSGVIVGSTYGEDGDGDTFTDAFIHTASGGFQDLNTLIPAGSGWVLTDAVGVNDAGQIICEADQTSGGDIHAFLLTPTA
jgi:hypothetical protein